MRATGRLTVISLTTSTTVAAAPSPTRPAGTQILRLMLIATPVPITWPTQTTQTIPATDLTMVRMDSMQQISAVSVTVVTLQLPTPLPGLL